MKMHSFLPFLRSKSWHHLIGVVISTCFLVESSMANNCETPIPSHVYETMERECVNAAKAQIKAELEASVTYLAMAAHFGRDVINRLGLSNFFFENASEERLHAIKLIDYLLLRGASYDGISGKTIVPRGNTWKNGHQALTDALRLEKEVTDKLIRLGQVCEGHGHEDGKSLNADKGHDYHMVDYITTDYLGEQYHSMRDIAGKLSTLEKLMKDNGMFGEYLFDRKLLKGEVM